METQLFFRMCSQASADGGELFRRDGPGLDGTSAEDISLEGDLGTEKFQ
jgi:hypothetical protein